MSYQLMKCGHTANAVDEKGNQCCVICTPNPDAHEIETDLPDLSDRKSQCSDCNSIVDSSFNLPFFEYRPNRKYDNHYDGCYGWN